MDVSFGSLISGKHRDKVEGLLARIPGAAEAAAGHLGRHRCVPASQAS